MPTSNRITENVSSFDVMLPDAMYSLKYESNWALYNFITFYIENADITEFSVSSASDVWFFTAGNIEKNPVDVSTPCLSC